ncbi:MAG: hypothetical protein WC205_18360 [Opitutaceae bacterium]|jgi:autotransporter-associated beta strand protein/predicted outer membrane repeat protein
MRFPFIALILTTASAALTGSPLFGATIGDDTTANLSDLLTAQPSLTFPDIVFQGSSPASGNSTAVLSVDLSHTFSAASANQRSSIGQSGTIALESGTTLKIQGSSSYRSGIYLTTALDFAITSADSTTKLVFENSADFGYNTYGGAIRNAGGNLRIAGTTEFTGNQAVNYSGYGTSASYGGAIYVSTGSVLLSGDVSFTDNVSGDLTWGAGYGGAIYSASGKVELTSSSTFTENSAGYGGAVALNGNNSHTIHNGTFTGNTARQQGGAIYNRSNLTLSGTNLFEDNTTLYTNGGAILHAPTASQVLTINDATFRRNTAATAGGAIANTGELILTGSSLFEENTATTDSGGAIYSFNGAQITLTNASFIRNTAALQGGAIYTNGSYINYNVTTGNTALISGNTANGVSNFLYISASGLNHSDLLIDTEAGATLDMRDAIVGYAHEFTGDIYVFKSGEGTWKLGGNNDFSAAIDTTFEVTEGTLYLYGQDEVSNATTVNPSAMVQAGHINLTGANSTFKLANTATLVAGGANSINASSTVTLDGGSTVKGGSGITSLALTGSSVRLGTQAGHVVTFNAATGDTLTVTTTLSGPGDLLKNGAGTVAFVGSSTFTGAVEAAEGVLDFSASVQNITGVEFTVGLTVLDSAQIVFNASQTFSDNALMIDFGSAALASLGSGAEWDLFDGAATSFTGVSIESLAVVSAFTSSGGNLWTYDNGEGVALTFDQNTGVLSVTAVPEPASFAALAGLLSLSLTYMRRRKRV